LAATTIDLVFARHLLSSLEDIEEIELLG
jgi:hypothetical protein